MPDTRGSRQFLERSGIVPTYRRPLPMFGPAQLTVHHLTLRPPLPLGEILDFINGEPPPDRGVTQLWPPANVGP